MFLDKVDQIDNFDECNLIKVEVINHYTTEFFKNYCEIVTSKYSKTWWIEGKLVRLEKK